MYCYIKTFFITRSDVIDVEVTSSKADFQTITDRMIDSWYHFVTFLLYSNSFYCFTLPEEFPVEI